MTLRSTLFPVQFKLDAEKLDFDKSQIGAANLSSGGIFKNGDFVLDVGSVHGVIPNNVGAELPDKSKTVDQNCTGRVASVVAVTPIRSRLPVVLGDSREAGGLLPSLVRDSREAGGLLPSPVRLMGAEGTPERSKPVLGENMENPELLSISKDVAPDEGVRGVSPVGVVGTASIEVTTEGKWRNVRKIPANPQTQANCLRQILLLQLDLIEQQQQQLQAKDKEIEDLKADKDTLLARIERMERRLQLTRKDPQDKRLFQPLQPWTPDKDDLWDMTMQETPQTDVPKPHTFSRGGKGNNKRKLGLVDPKNQKPRGKGGKFAVLQKPDCGAGTPFQRELRSKETPETVGPETVSPGRTMADCNPFYPDKEESDFTPQMEDLPFMSTTEMYLCRWHQPPPSPLREVKKEEEEASLAVPSWREKSVEPWGEESEVPEVLDDNVFLKRHSKHELDEKRRKRWDIQRIREQRMFQRLQQRMNKKKGIQDVEPELSSFYPDCEDVESIIITPFLPVVAFGRPLPKLTQEWYHGAGGGSGRVAQKDLSSKRPSTFPG